MRFINEGIGKINFPNRRVASYLSSPSPAFHDL